MVCSSWRKTAAAAALAFGLGLGTVIAQIAPDVIYGDDDRLDLHQVQSEKLRAMAKSTVGLFQSGNVKIDSEGKVANLTTESYSDSYGLCKEEPFYDQRTGAFCSGSLVAPDLIMTAGHCVRSQSSCETTKFVFGFAIGEKGGSTPSSLPAGEVFGCKELIGSTVENTGADWALVRLDRAVTEHAPLKINRSGTLAKGAPLIVIGHPAGLPTKVAGGATVRDPDQNGHFVANLDTYGGNSGSAVFNATTGEIEGILVRGERDYVSRNGCMVSNVCTNDGCRGEDVTKVGEVASKIPEQGPGAAFNKPGPAFSALLSLGKN